MKSIMSTADLRNQFETTSGVEYSPARYMAIRGSDDIRANVSFRKLK